jgi:L-lactate utilization protein LutC
LIELDGTKRVLDEAKKTLEKPFLTTKPQNYWIAFRVDRTPIEESTYYCEDYSINISRRSEPGNKENLAKAVREFRAKRALKLKEQHKESKNITTLQAYLELEECQKFVEEKNKKQEAVKQLKRTQNLRKPKPP